MIFGANFCSCARTVVCLLALLIRNCSAAAFTFCAHTDPPPIPPPSIPALSTLSPCSSAVVAHKSTSLCVRGEKEKIECHLREFFSLDFIAVQTVKHCATHSTWEQCSTVQHTVQHSAAQCSTVQTQCNRLQHTATHCNTLQHTATHCNTLQHTAAHCSTLQHIAAHCSTLQHTAAHCNTVQHTATQCNTLQHTATHCNTQ